MKFERLRGVYHLAMTHWAMTGKSWRVGWRFARLAARTKWAGLKGEKDGG